MTFRTVFLGIGALALLNLTSTAYASDSANGPARSEDSSSTTNASTFHGYFGVVKSEFSPVGATPQQFFASAPKEWQIQGWDITFGFSGKKRVRGPVYFGGGIGMMLGGGQDDFVGSSTWVDESYGRLGFDGCLDLGVRFPIGKNQHLDLGAKLGGFYDRGGGGESDFSYSHAILWYGPGIALEPNAGSPGVIAGATLRLPLAGEFSMESLLRGGDSRGYDVKSQSVLRVEAGFKFKNGFALVGYGEQGGFEFEDGSANSFDQESSALGLEFRFAY